MKPWLLLAVLWSGPAPVQQDLAVRIEVQTEVEFGKAFALSVVRTWSKDLVPESFDDAALSPLVARLDGAEQRDDGTRIEETLRYRCYAFTRGALTIPAPSLRARPLGGGEIEEVTGEPVLLLVSSALPLEAIGPAELPRGPFPPPPSITVWILTGTGLIVAVLLGRVGFVRRRDRVPPGPPPVRPGTRAWEGLQVLREQEPEGHDAVRAFYVEASGLVRTFIEAEFAVHAPGMTTDEFLANPITSEKLTDPQRSLLDGFLNHCDQVKFARYSPTRGEREAMLGAAEDFVEEAGAAADEPDPGTTPREGTRAS
jgi:hypothetical protein